MEKDEDCRQTLVENNSKIARALFGDITTVSPSDIIGVTGLEPEETFLVAGGPPCQAFSTAGLRRSVNERGITKLDRHTPKLSYLGNIEKFLKSSSN